jgi:hypothetical protein
VQICICDVNVAIDLPGLPQILAPATDQSCAATSSANTLIGVGCPHPAPWCANLHSARRSPRHRLPFPAGSFIEGFRTPATVQAASLRSAGIRNPQQTRKSSMRAYVFRVAPESGHRANAVGMSVSCQKADPTTVSNLTSECAHRAISARTPFQSNFRAIAIEDKTKRPVRAWRNAD